MTPADFRNGLYTTQPEYVYDHSQIQCSTLLLISYLSAIEILDLDLWLESKPKSISLTLLFFNPTGTAEKTIKVCPYLRIVTGSLDGPLEVGSFFDRNLAGG